MAFTVHNFRLKEYACKKSQIFQGLSPHSKLIDPTNNSYLGTFEKLLSLTRDRKAKVLFMFLNFAKVLFMFLNFEIKIISKYKEFMLLYILPIFYLGVGDLSLYRYVEDAFFVVQDQIVFHKLNI